MISDDQTKPLTSIDILKDELDIKDEIIEKQWLTITDLEEQLRKAEYLLFKHSIPFNGTH